MSESKPFKKREDRWIREWMKAHVFEADPDPSKKKFFVTFPYPYMNGSLHLGHAYTSGRLDVIARFKRLKGYNVLYPWAWHWTGEAVMGIVHRLESNDTQLIKRLIELDGVEESEVKKFLDPVYLVKYFTKQGKEDIIRFGNSIDWRREFHTTKLHPLYNKFIQWQIKTLYKKGYIGRAPHPVVWCPKDESPTGDHDRLTGEGVRPEEYYLIKFELLDPDKIGFQDKKIYLVAGTIRPETLYGVTNIWIRDDCEYVVAQVNNEYWVISEYAAFKLSNQLRDVRIVKRLHGSNLIGMYVKAPLINRIIPILPAKFIDLSTLTGIVYSVPSDAPYDWVALRDLKREISIDNPLYEIVAKITPISIIKVEGYGDYPAVEIVESMGISNQLDKDKLDVATKEIYSKEYHLGIMKDCCGVIAGLKVHEAKEEIIAVLSNLGMLEKMYDLPEPVICRCGTRTIVKIIKDQWLLKYSDPKWKEKAKEALSKMKLYPKEARSLFEYYIDWYNDWPCTRKTGLGTPFPFDESWIVETLTDSTIYMAFYTIAKYYNQGLINPEYIKDSFFNYILLGIGDLDKVADENKLNKELIKRIREEFLYWYPVDLRGSGKDLIGNHLTFFIFHHAAIFPEDLWPRGIAVNGFVLLNGRPMSKSKGNYISLRKAMELYGADAVRLTILTITDGLEDPDIRTSDMEANMRRIESIPAQIKKWIESSYSVSDISFFDKMLVTKIQNAINEVEEALEDVRVAAAGRIIFHQIPEYIREYFNIADKPNKSIVYDCIKAWVILMSMYTPYIAEDIWHDILKEDSFVSTAKWPSMRSNLIDELLIYLDSYFKELLSDIEHILYIIKVDDQPFELYIITAADWKWTLLKRLYSVKRDKITIRDIFDVAKTCEIQQSKNLAEFARFICKEWFSRYTKFKPLLESERINESYMGQLLKDVFTKYLHSRFKNLSKIVILNEDRALSDSRLSKYRGKVIKAAPLYPSIIIFK